MRALFYKRRVYGGCDIRRQYHMETWRRRPRLISIQTHGALRHSHKTNFTDSVEVFKLAADKMDSIDTLTKVLLHLPGANELN